MDDERIYCWNGRIKKTLLDYRKFVADHDENPALPGLDDFTNEQLYFLAYANICIQ